MRGWSRAPCSTSLAPRRCATACERRAARRAPTRHTPAPLERRARRVCRSRTRGPVQPTRVPRLSVVDRLGERGRLEPSVLGEAADALNREQGEELRLVVGIRRKERAHPVAVAEVTRLSSRVAVAVQRAQSGDVARLAVVPRPRGLRAVEDRERGFDVARRRRRPQRLYVIAAAQYAIAQSRCDAMTASNSVSARAPTRNCAAARGRGQSARSCRRRTRSPCARRRSRAGKRRAAPWPACRAIGATQAR
jgi:hypothetical protein